MLFSSWVLLDLYIWASNDPSSILFFWSIIILIEVLIYIFSIYFIDVFNEKKDVSFKKKLLMSILILPIVIGLPTYLNLAGIEMSFCVALEGVIAKYYVYAVEIFSIMWILFYSFRFYGKTVDPSTKKQIIFSTTGILFFLLALSSGNLIGSLTEQWQYSQYGLFAMPIFIGILAYLVVKYNAFNIKLIATQVLVWGLAILIGSQFFFIKVPINMVLNGVTFVASIIFGYFLIKSVKKEIEQKEELAKLNIDLEALIKQRESLTHLITHKVKGSFTHSKYIFAGILDGTFGIISPELQKMAEKGIESDDVGINTVDLILNAANMQKGLIKYDMKKTDFKEVVLKVFSEKKVPAETKGLQIEKNIKEDDYSVLGDSFWLKEAVNNLVDNSMKYTKEGKITVKLEKKDGKILLFVQDTGMGITEEDKKNLFTEGGRGRDSVKINVDSTGYGLYTVKLIIEAHKGRVWAESAGPGKGSTFFVELPAV
ncbi:hypothetical protein A3A07_02535 [Candidatus Nomurabacteria bacterium RIFCSPLOWO2_01_FULL_41_52]|nr:MAG: hypothetical protein A3A07_02535 [Candidatus Nomurabacteria bacterium RIFCSPLOWO2_01_FULL_41_52]